VTTARLPPDARGVLTFRDRHLGVLSVWAHPHDPLLPGLAWACDPEAATPTLFPAALVPAWHA
jgi:hypothetical protein